MKKLTVAMESYLEVVYDLSQGASTGVRVTDIAAQMDVSKASVNNAMAVLAGKGLIDNERYQEIRLTPAGKALAKLIALKHGIIEEFFIKALNIDPEIACVDACAIEHIISPDSIKAMYQYLIDYNIPTSLDLDIKDLKSVDKNNQGEL
ncbi:MAG TPA: metal-dependent transcriptional regulator [Clostridia bacterium]|nr:metal-dependent transcriptional regulator [Clostridia bacterium]